MRVEPFIHGGGHEQGMRSGTLATHQIVGMGEAFYLSQQEMLAEVTRIKKLRTQLLEGLKAIPNLHLNAEGLHLVPNIINLRFEGMVADAILAKLPDIAASTASACRVRVQKAPMCYEQWVLAPSKLKVLFVFHLEGLRRLIMLKQSLNKSTLYSRPSLRARRAWQSSF